MNRPIPVVFSSINLAMTPGALRGPEWLGDYVHLAGCDGVEYMPMFDKLPGHTPKAIGQAASKGLLELNSLHATFRETKASANTNKLPGDPEHDSSLVSRVLSSRLGRLILPEVCESSSIMRDIQTSAGKRVPVVLYPQRDFTRDGRQIASADGSRTLFQPTDHVARLVGRDTSMAEFDAEMSDMRRYEYVLDTFHARRLYGRGDPGLISNVAVSIPFMAPKTRALHLSLHRTDIPEEKHIPTVREARQAFAGIYEGELRDMLDTVKEAGNVEYAVIEMTTNSVSELTGHRRDADIQKDYADIADGFREYWQAA